MIPDLNDERTSKQQTQRQQHLAIFVFAILINPLRKLVSAKISSFTLYPVFTNFFVLWLKIYHFPVRLNLSEAHYKLTIYSKASIKSVSFLLLPRKVFSLRFLIKFSHDVNPLSVNPKKWSNTLKQFVGCCRWMVGVCLTIFGGWHLNG